MTAPKYINNKTTITKVSSKIIQSASI